MWKSRFKALCVAFLLGICGVHAQVNADQVTAIGRNVLSMEDYVLAIQYFNLAIKAKPYLADPYFFRALAKLNLEDYKGAEEDCSLAIERNKFKTEAYKLRGFARQNLGKDSLAVDDYNVGLYYAPLDKYFLYYKATAQTELKDYAGADSTFRVLMRAYPRFEDGMVARARSSLLQGDTIKAIADIGDALAISKNLTNAYLMRADIYSQRRDWPNALTDLNEALRLAPKEPSLYINRAFVRYNSDDYFGAMSDYNYALELDPGNRAAIFNRALLRSEVKDYDRAVEDFTAVLSAEPGNVHALYNRGLIYLEQKKAAEALADFEATARRFPRFYPVYYAIAQAKQDLGDLRGAGRSVKHAESLVKGYVKDPQKNALDRPTIDAGRQNAQGSGEDGSEENQEELMNKFNRLVTVSATSETQLAYGDKIRGKLQDRDVRVEPEASYAVSFFDTPDVLRSSSNYFRELDDFNHNRYIDYPIYLSNSRNSATEQQLDNMIKRADGYTRIIESGRARPADYLARGLANIDLRNYEAAVGDLDKAIEAGGGSFTIAFMARGYARYAASRMEHASASDQKEKNNPLGARSLIAATGAAIQDYDKALKLNPRLIYAWFNKGNIYYDAQDYTSAIQCYSEAIRINPEFGKAYFNRALVYLHMGNRRQAFSDLSKAGELGVLPSYNLLKRMK